MADKCGVTRKMTCFFTIISLPLLCLLTCSRAQDPCDTGFRFAVGRERDPLYIPSEPRIKVCDILIRAWYRIIGPGQVDLDLYNRQPIRGRCDTANPIWMNGPIPTGGEHITNQLCVVNESEDCSDQEPLPVKDCGEFRVYLLSPATVCPSAYCVDFNEEPPTTFAPDCSDTIPVVIETPVVRPFVSESDDDKLKGEYDELKFQCELHTVDPILYYDVTWYINGLNLKQFRPTSVAGSQYNQTNLLERHWRDTFKMGMKVNCSVAARLQPNCRKGPESFSEEFFAGIKVFPTDMVFNETDPPRNITFTCTVPIACKTTELEACAVFLFIADSKTERCPNQSNTIVASFSSQPCQLQFTNTDWNQTKTHAVNAEYSQDFDLHTFEISMKTHRYRNTGHPDLWENVILPSVKVTIIDTDSLLSNTLCQVHNDPYYEPFDGWWYSNNMKGEFVMFRHKSAPVAVHVLHETCGHYLTCVCGVAVQSGLDVFTWVGCKAVKNIYKQSRTRPFGCFKSGIIVKEIVDGKHYEVLTPNGIKVTIGLEFYEDFYMRVSIDAPPDNQGQVEGMCGGLQANGAIGVDGIDPEKPDKWSVPLNNSLFYNRHKNDNRTFNVSFCTCRRNATRQENAFVCSTSRALTPTCYNLGGKDVTERFTYACEQKRDLGWNDLVEDWPDLEINVSYNPPPPVWTNGWNQQSAEAFCTNFHHNSTVYKRCREIEGIRLDGSLAMCVDMIHVTGDVMWSLQTLEPYKSRCRFEVTRNSSYWVSSPGQTSVVDTVLEIMCPDNCNGHGTCNRGVCECDSSHLGADCGIDIFKPPNELVLPNKGLCDLNKKLCERVLVIGSQFVNMEKFGCRLKTIEITPNATRDTGKMVQCRASYHTRNEALVIIEPFGDFDDLDDVSTPTVIGYKLSLTNDEKTYSDDVIFLPHDSTCFACDITKQNVTCQIKEGYCNIDYQCVASGTSKADDSCTVCDPSRSTVTWTNTGCTLQPTIDDSIPLWIPITAAVLAACVLILVLGLVVRCMRKRGASKDRI